MKKLFFVLLCTLFCATSRCSAAEEWGWRVAATTTDLFIARPFTFAATIVGSALWVATLPITAPTKTHRDAFDVMIAQPWQYTVDRPLGEFGE